jgi:hypothetical protein
MIDLKYILSAIYIAFSCFIFVGYASAQQPGQNPSNVKPQRSKAELEKEKQELRAKACGSETVNFEARTDKSQHPTPEPPADKALIYVLRTTMIGFKIDSKLAVDGKWVGVNRGNTYFFFTVDPGEHYFCSESENQSYLALTVEAGKTYYLQQKVKAGVWKARTELVVMAEDVGRKELADVHLSVFEIKK